jgi:protocatechuate 3,4-dioxygenase beta subunit
MSDAVHGEGTGRTRRAVLRDAGAAGLGLAGIGLLGCGEDDAASPASTAAAETATGTGTSTPACTLAPEMTEGPYYVDLERVRRNITEGSAGLPLRLETEIVDATSCEPLSGAAVDIWHCDALGVYSGIESEGTAGETYLRGIQLTGDDGVATFETVFPGWYPGRVTHIHLKVHEGSSIASGTERDGTLEGGHVAHTGQLFFPDKRVNEVYELEPYADHEGTRTLLSADSIYLGGDGARVHLTQVDKDDISKGLVGRITLGVDPDAEPTETGAPGGAPPPGTPPPS